MNQPPETSGTSRQTVPPEALELELSDEDILDALAHISGYIDISTEDFRAIYHLAWRHAVSRLRAMGTNPLDDGDHPP